ncbi:MAG: endonuclease [Bacteriovoracaceae bacterium]|nr:endonuclease [Bacteriovoracaceae bacterium]
MTKILIFSLVFPLLCISSIQATIHDYYPVSYADKLEKGMIQDAKLKRALIAIWSKKHLVRQGLRDVLTDNCPADLSDDSASCKGKKVLGYFKARKYLFGQLHLKEDESGYFVRGVYCNKRFTTDDFGSERTIGPMSIPNSNILNCEHTWPQSKFNKRKSTSAQKSDLHHLYPTASFANSERADFPFAEVDGHFLSDSCQISSVGIALDFVKRRYMFFEPPNQHKGNVARALFYFSVVYDMRIDKGQEEYLRKWHRDDPVDEEESIRNNAIMKIQGTRNPFIDIPELVDRVSDF